MPNPDRCAWKRCRRPATMTYLKRPLCQWHWDKWCLIDDNGTREQRHGALAAMRLLNHPIAKQELVPCDR